MNTGQLPASKLSALRRSIAILKGSSFLTMVLSETIGTA